VARDSQFCAGGPTWGVRAAWWWRPVLTTGQSWCGPPRSSAGVRCSSSRARP